MRRRRRRLKKSGRGGGKRLTLNVVHGLREVDSQVHSLNALDW